MTEIGGKRGVLRYTETALSRTDGQSQTSRGEKWSTPFFSNFRSKIDVCELLVIQIVEDARIFTNSILV